MRTSAGVSNCNPGQNLNTEDHGMKWVNCMNSVFNPFCHTHLFKNLFVLHT